jgi:hypothetical protein
MQLRPLDSSPTCQLTKTAITLKTPPGVRAQYSTISRSVLRRSFRRSTSAIRTGCVKKRSSGPVEGVVSNHDPYFDQQLLLLGAHLLQGQGLAGRFNPGGGFSRPSPCVPNDQRSTSHFYRSKEQIVRTCSREVKDWKDETGQENSGSFYYACDDVRPAICCGLQDPRQQNHGHRDLHEYCDS